MAPKTAKIKIKCDVSPAQLFVELFTRAVKSSGCAVQKADLPLDLIRIEQVDLPAKTGEVFMRLYPSDAFLRFAAATLAREFNLSVINDPIHKKCSTKKKVS